MENLLKLEGYWGESLKNLYMLLFISKDVTPYVTLP